LGSFGVDEDRLQSVASRYRSLDDYVPFSDENTSQISLGSFSALAQRLVAQALKHIDAGISGVLYCYEHTVILIEANSNGNKEEKFVERASGNTFQGGDVLRRSRGGSQNSITERLCSVKWGVK